MKNTLQTSIFISYPYSTAWIIYYLSCWQSSMMLIEIFRDLKCFHPLKFVINSSIRAIKATSKSTNYISIFTIYQGKIICMEHLIFSALVRPCWCISSAADYTLYEFTRFQINSVVATIMASVDAVLYMTQLNNLP